jgi:hypothetical protein
VHQISQESVRERFDYNPETGDLIVRKTGRAIRRKHYARGYYQVVVDRKHYLVHRLIWLHVYGVLPPEIDHINGCVTDNRLVNLRAATRALNSRNRKTHKNNTSGHKGVSWMVSRGKWKAQIVHDRRPVYLGLFERKEDAIRVRLDAERKLFGEYARKTH